METGETDKLREREGDHLFKHHKKGGDEDGLLTTGWSQRRGNDNYDILPINGVSHQIDPRCINDAVNTMHRASLTGMYLF